MKKIQKHIKRSLPKPVRVGLVLIFAVTAGLLIARSFGLTTNGTGGAFTDRTFQSFTASSGLSGEYHIYAAGLTTTQPVGLMVQFHGDAAYEYLNPNSSYSLGGTTGIRAQAKAHNMILVVAKAPDTTGTVTWWEAGSANADYTRDLIQQVAYNKYNIDRNRIWLNGYSGGAQFITQFFMPKYSSMIDGGGAVIFGGGGTPRVTVQPFAAALKPKFHMHWYTGALDNGSCSSDGYNALRDANNGSAYYQTQGFTTSIETPAGVCHDLSGRFGTVTGQQLALYDVPSSSSPVGDINSDGRVNAYDLSTLLGDWGSTTARSDLNGSGRVDVFDLSTLLSRWTG